MSETSDKLTAALAQLLPSHLEIQDYSHLHAGHTGNTGGSHFTVFIVSEQFAGLSLIKRHRLVYETVGNLLEKDIHALSINAKTPSELTK